ncbi:uncharacterized protein LOC135109455 [Scylla paramamosain]|uniref:uncharacterized protein LOC135109455 n=1 Tax=Scylla paramamosain TaxID=85552 RepID=UPI0030835097
MDNFPQPTRFDGRDATLGDWENWLKTFTNFISSLGNRAPDKLILLKNYLSSSVFNHIKDCSKYEEAIEVLESLYVKPVNEVLARHQLATRKKQSNESTDQFLQALKLMSIGCMFKVVSASVYAQEAIRDTFISGLSSSTICQRLPEKHTLTLNEAVLYARSLELAQRSTNCYVLPGPSPTSGPFSAASDSLLPGIER